jgi:large conductance mechanosensitive channel
MWKEFKAFLIKDNIIGLAIAVILGLALNKLVTSVVDDLIMPIINLASAATGDSWKDWYIPLTSAGADGPRMLIGNIIGNVINFLVIGLVCFLFAKAFVRPKPSTS